LVWIWRQQPGSLWPFNVPFTLDIHTLT
jgi:hypothetical protein